MVLLSAHSSKFKDFLEIGLESGRIRLSFKLENSAKVSAEYPNGAGKALR